jgi:hypothetical protein
MASELKPPTTKGARGYMHPEPESQMRHEVGRRVGTADPNAEVVAHTNPRSLSARKVFVIVLIFEV